MDNKILILLAVKEELGRENVAKLAEQHDVAITGVGKLRAYEATLKALQQKEYKTVINVGTSGSFRHNIGTILSPSKVVQGDIYIDSIFATQPELLDTGDPDISIVSSDDFIGSDTPELKRRLLEPHDCMDMESYAMVRAIKLHSELNGTQTPKIHILKIISDACDGTVEDWNSRIVRLRPHLFEALYNLIDSINQDK